MRRLGLAVAGALLAAGACVAAEPVQRLRAVCSTTQTADFTRQITGDDWEVLCILGPGVNPHGYQPVPADSRMAASADLCVQNGPLVTGTDGIPPLALDYEGKSVDDPHAWFDPRNAAVYVNNILEGVVAVDPSGAARYRVRAELYLQQLRALDGWIQKRVSAVPEERRVLVTSHDAFNYYGTRYGFKVRSPVGWSTGSEIGGGMTPGRRRAVVESVREFGVPAIFVETSVNPKLLEQIASEAGVAIGGLLYSDAMGGAGSAGESYIGMMRENTLMIVNGLGGL
jgi:manganese/iron transport system substrate-binding protein